MLMYATRDVEAYVASLHVCYPIMNSERSLRSSLPLYSDRIFVMSIPLCPAMGPCTMMMPLGSITTDTAGECFRWYHKVR